MHTLSKSDFKLGRTCPTKLFYKKQRYQTTLDEDAYLELLAEGGYMVEEIARLLYPNGRPVPHDRGTQHALQATRDLLDAGHTEFFEPTFEHEGLLLRVDIFRMMPGTRTIELIEVKAKSWDSSLLERPTLRKRGGPGIMAGWQDYIADVAFQMVVLERIFPDYTVIPYLVMPDKAKTTSVDLLHRHFRVRRETTNGFTRFDVEFTGDPDILRKDHFLTKVNMQEEVDLIRPEVEETIPVLMGTLRPELTRAEPTLDVNCRNCEYRTAPYAESGYAVCWGEHGEHEHHLFDLRRGTQIPGSDGLLFDEMIAEGRTHLLDIDESRVCGKNGVGKTNERQLIQIRCTRDGVEWQDDALGRELAAAPYPLHFIDFETSSLAIPYHAGMAPYESVAFQWSCHTVPAPGIPDNQQPVHAEWINTEDAFPNIEFVRTLRQQIGDEGSVLIWSHHEQTILKTIRRQMTERVHPDDAADNHDLLAWLEEFLDSGRILDMEKWCGNWYFHPRMKGKTSIKDVCDAIWQTNHEIRAAFPEYVAADPETGAYLSPYDALPPALIDDAEFGVSVGTDAVRAYQSMMVGLHRDDPEARAQIRDALLRYCKLDTAAMVMIWRHWEGRAASS